MNKPHNLLKIILHNNDNFRSLIIFLENLENFMDIQKDKFIYVILSEN